MRDCGGDGGFGGDVAFGCFEAGLEGGEQGVDFSDGSFEGRGGNGGHEHIGSFTSEDDGCFEADAAVEAVFSVLFS